MLGQFTRQDEADRGLDFSRGDGRLLVVGSQVRSLGGDTLEDIWVTRQQEAKERRDAPEMWPTVDKRVQDGHGAVGNASVGVHLLEH